MRVAFLAANYPPSIGGAQLLLQRIAEGLVHEHGWEVEVVTTDAMRSPGGVDPGRVGPPDDVVNGVEVHRRPAMHRLHRSLRTVRRASRKTSLRRLGDAVHLGTVGPLGIGLYRSALRAADRADVVVGVAAGFTTLAATRTIARRTGRPYVTLPLVHLSTSKQFASSVRAMAQADAVVALTEVERQWAISRGASESSTVTIPPGCDAARGTGRSAASARAALQLPEAPTVGYVGRMAPHKGIDTLADAMTELWKRIPSARLLLAGSHGGWSGYEHQVATLRSVAGDRLTVIGRFADEDKLSLFEACDVIAFPSREESFGIVTLEAWSARRAPVVGDIDVARSIVRDHVDGLLVPVGDPAGWAEALEGLISDPETALAYGRAGYDRVAGEFDWSHVVSQWAEVLTRAAATHGSAV